MQPVPLLQNPPPGRQNLSQLNAQASTFQGPKKRIACVFISSLANRDNEHAAVVWGRGMAALGAREDVRLDAIFVGEPRPTDVGQEDVVGDQARSIMILCYILFSATDGIAVAWALEHEQHDILRVAAEYQTLETRTLGRGDLDDAMIRQILEIPGLWSRLAHVACSPDFPSDKYWDDGLRPLLRLWKRLESAEDSEQTRKQREEVENFMTAHVTGMLSYCIPPPIGPGSMPDTMLCAELDMLDCMDVMKLSGSWERINFFLDAGPFEANAQPPNDPANLKTRHAEYLVPRSAQEFTDFTNAKLRDQRLSMIGILAGARDSQADDLHGDFPQSISPSDGAPKTPTTAFSAPRATSDTNQESHLHGWSCRIKRLDFKTDMILPLELAHEVVIFGAGSLTILDNILKHNPMLAIKITYVGQGATFVPKLHLSGQTWNFAMDTIAADRVLQVQMDFVEGYSETPPLKRFALTTTELGIDLEFTPRDLGHMCGEGEYNSRLEMRSAAYGFDENRGDLAAFRRIWDSRSENDTYSRQRDKSMRSPALCAMLAGFSSTFAMLYTGSPTYPTAVLRALNPLTNVFTNESPFTVNAPYAEYLPIPPGRIEVWEPPEGDASTRLELFVMPLGIIRGYELPCVARPVAQRCKNLPELVKECVSAFRQLGDVQ